MGFISILGTNRFGENAAAKDFMEKPLYFDDLNLNQIVDRIRNLRPDYDLKKYYYVLLEDPRQIKFRQEVLKDFYNEDIVDAAMNFSNGLLRARNYMDYAMKSEHIIQRKRWRIDAAYAYINAVKAFAEFMSGREVQSEGMKELKKYLLSVAYGNEFKEFYESTVELMEKMLAISFTLELERNSITVNAGRTDEHYVERIAGILENDVAAGVGTYFTSPLKNALVLSGIEERIILLLQKEYPEEFAALDKYSEKYKDFIDEVLVRLEEEMQFYIAYVLFRKSIAEYNFSFSAPQVYEEANDGEFVFTQVYDLALACKNAEQGITTISNTIEYRDKERFLVITGPNQGGKTTAARSMGQAVYFAMLGLEVPAEAAKLPVFHGIMTHFEVEESLDTGAGKLKEELNRLKPMMERTGQRKFVVINELFTTAASYDAYIMGSHVLKHFIELDYFGIYVTHIKELANESEAVASLVAGISEADGKTRTYKIERRPAEGIGHASTLVDKYGLGYNEIKEGLLR